MAKRSRQAVKHAKLASVDGRDVEIKGLVRIAAVSCLVFWTQGPVAGPVGATGSAQMRDPGSGVRSVVWSTETLCRVSIDQTTRRPMHHPAIDPRFVRRRRQIGQDPAPRLTLVGVRCPKQVCGRGRESFVQLISRKPPWRLLEVDQTGMLNRGHSAERIAEASSNRFLLFRCWTHDILGTSFSLSDHALRVISIL